MAAQRFVLGTCAVDLEARTIDGQPGLRPIEARLLGYLVERDGAIVPQSELLERVWGYASGVRTRTVYSTVHRLRQIIEVDPASPRHLLTEHGTGVRLVGVVPTPAGGGLVGRRRELDALRTAAAPVLAVTGLGGVGKSRLVAAWAAEVGAPRCDLAGVRSTDAAADRAAGVLGVTVAAVDAAARSEPVVVLDQADELDDVADLAARWAPCRLVVARREPLPGTSQLPVRPLSPDEGLELLIARIHDRDRTFDAEPVRTELRGLAERVGGLPLALELLARHVAALGAESVASALDVDDGSLAAIVGWTRGRLPPAVRAVLDELSVFAGAFTLAQAEQVASERVHDALVVLVERGAVTRADGSFAVVPPLRSPHPPDDALRRLVDAVLADAVAAGPGGAGRSYDLDAARVALRWPAPDPRQRPLLAAAHRELVEAGRFTEATGLVRDVWEGRSHPSARVFAGVKLVIGSLGSLREAMRLRDEVTALARQEGLAEDVVILHALVGANLAIRGDRAGSLAALAEVEACAPGLSERPADRRAAAAATVALVRLQCDPSESALDDAREAAAGLGEESDRYLRGGLHSALASRLLRSQSFHESLRGWRRSREILPRRANAEQLVAWVGEAAALLPLRRIDEAGRALDQAERHLGERCADVEVQLLLFRAGHACERGELAEAGAIAADARRVATLGRQPRWELGALGIELAAARRGGEDVEPDIMSALREMLGRGMIPSARALVAELVDCAAAGRGAGAEEWLAAMVDAWPEESDHAATLHAELLRLAGRSEDASALLARPPTSPSPEVRARRALARIAFACEAGAPVPSALPSGVADPRWEALYRWRIARCAAPSTPPPPVAVGAWEHLIAAAAQP